MCSLLDLTKEFNRLAGTEFTETRIRTKVNTVEIANQITNAKRKTVESTPKFETFPLFDCMLSCYCYYHVIVLSLFLLIVRRFLD